MNVTGDTQAAASPAFISRSRASRRRKIQTLRRMLDLSDPRQLNIWTEDDLLLITVDRSDDDWHIMVVRDGVVLNEDEAQRAVFEVARGGSEMAKGMFCNMCETHTLGDFSGRGERVRPHDWMSLFIGDGTSVYDFCSEQCLLSFIELDMVGASVDAPVEP